MPHAKVGKDGKVFCHPFPVGPSHPLHPLREVPPLRSAQAGFSLVEVAIAAGLTAFCLLAIFGLLPIGLKSNQATINQTLANSVLSSVVADLRNTPLTTPRGTATNSPQFQFPLPANPVGTITSNTFYFTESSQLTNQANARFRLTVTFPTNGSAKRAATLANVKLTWPASVALDKAAGTIETFVALDRN